MSKAGETKTSGGCLCGAVRYEITGEPAFAAFCSCDDCKKASGADHITAAFFQTSQVSISGEATGYTSPAASGNTITRSFCPKCGSRLFAASSGRDGMIGIQVGTMDGDAAMVKPVGLVYASDKRSWDCIDDALPQFEKMPPAPK